MQLVSPFLFSSTTILNNLKYYVCVILIAIFLKDLFVPTVIQYDGVKHIKLSSEGKVRHVYEMCDNKLRQDISRDTWAANEHF